MANRDTEPASSDLTVDLPEAFERELREKFALEGEDILDTVREPDMEDRLVMDDLELRFFQRYIPQSPAPYDMLVYGRRLDGSLRVNMAWKIRPGFLQDTHSDSPLDTLEAFGRRYGLEISLPGGRERFVLNRTFELDPDEKGEGLRIHNPEGHEYVQQIFTRTTQRGGKTVIDCALAMCIDIDVYRAAMSTG